MLFQSLIDGNLWITYGLVISIVTSFGINRFTYLFLYFRSLYPPNLRHSNDSFRRWKWRNFSISFIHSLITGIGSLLCILFRPRLLIEVIDEYLEMSYLLTAFSHGYFLYDLYEMITHLEYKGSKELVIHHILILCCFSLTVFQRKYCGYSSIALLIEISNIFLHFRQLLLIANTPKWSTIYRTNSYLNINLYVLIRGICLLWLWITLFWVLPRVAIIPKLIAFVSLIGICIMTSVLFLRIYKSDFSRNTSKQLDNKSSCNDKMIANHSTGAQSNSQQSNGLVFNPNFDSMHSKTT